MPTHLHCSASSCSPINSKHIKMFPQYLSSPIPICTCCALPFFIAISLVFPCPPQNVQHLHRHFLLHFLAPLRMSSTSIAIFSFISLPPSECPAPPSPFSLAFPCPPQNVQHLHMLCATLLHRHCLLYFLAPLRMSSTSIARASDDFYPRDSASSHPHVAACAYNTVCVYIYVCVCVCVRACLFL